MRILWLKNELLHPVDSGGRIRTYHMLRRLKVDHDITYIALDDGTAAPQDVERSSEYCHRSIRILVPAAPRGSLRFYAGVLASLFSRLPYVLWKYRSAGMRRVVDQLATRGEVDLVVSDFLFPAVNVPAGLPCSTILFQHNVETMIWRRHAEAVANPLARVYLKLQALRMERAEAAECRRFDRVIAVSDRDRTTMTELFGLSHVDAVATAVDADFFRPSSRVPSRSGGVVFTGAMDWMPNEDGILNFVESIWPLVRRSVPSATLTIVGRRPGPRIRSLADVGDGIRVTGAVPDVRPFLEEAPVFIVPLRIGGGTRLKIFEAMAMEKAIVSTSIGAEGLPVRDGEELMLADTAESFADAVVHLLSDDSAARAMGKRAAALVREHFSWDRISAEFAALCANAPARRALESPSTAPLLQNLR